MNPAPIKKTISFDDFEKLDIRVGTIFSVSDVIKSSKSGQITRWKIEHIGTPSTK